ATNGAYAKEIPRGAGAAFTDDSRFVVFHIKPMYRNIREARIRKKTRDQSPKDSLAWIELGTGRLTIFPRVKSYKLPEKDGEWIAYLREKRLPGTGRPDPGRRMANGDSGRRMTNGIPVVKSTPINTAYVQELLESRHKKPPETE